MTDVIDDSNQADVVDFRDKWDGRLTTKRLDTLDRLRRDGKITPVQWSAGMDYLNAVESYFAASSGLARLSEEAAAVGGAKDPITRYLKARPARIDRQGRKTGYIPTQRPRNPTRDRSYSDGWTSDRLEAMDSFSPMARLVQKLPRDPRSALCLMVIDPNRPDLPALSLNAACRRLFGYVNEKRYAIITGWLSEALDTIDFELVCERRAA